MKLIDSSLKIIVHGTPQPAGSKRFVGTRRDGRGIVIDANRNAASWKLRVSQVAARAREEADWPLLRGAVRVSFYFYRARPQSHYSKRKRASITPQLLPSAPVYWTTRPDRGKLQRACEDALTGVIYADDSQIVGGEVRKRWADADYCEIIVFPLEDQELAAVDDNDVIEVN